MPYNALLTNYLGNALQESTIQVQATESLVSDAVRKQAWHLLGLALKPEMLHLDAAEGSHLWGQARSLLFALAPKMEQAGFREEWIGCLQLAHEQSQRMADAPMMAECALQIGIIYRLMSRFADAHQWSRLSVERFAQLGDGLGERRSLNELAWLENLQHQYAEATVHVERALALSTSDDIERGMSYRVQGMIANSQRKWQEAQAYHEKALAIFERWNDQRRIAWGLQNLAISFHEQSRLEKAIELYQRAIQILDEIADHFHLAIIQMNLGVAYLRLNQPSKGLFHFISTSTLFYRFGDILNIARVETNLGLCYHALQNYQAAEHSFLAAIEAYDRLGDVAWRLNAVAGLGMTYNGARQYDKAITMLEQALSEIDQIKEHPYYTVTLNYLQQYLSEARQGQG